MAFSPETYVLLQGIVGKESEDVSDLKTRMTTAETDITNLKNNKASYTRNKSVGNALTQRLEGLYQQGADNTIISETVHVASSGGWYALLGFKCSAAPRNSFIFWGQGSGANPGHHIQIAVRETTESGYEWAVFFIDELYAIG